MTGWLVIVLAAPLASFGEDPGNARRGTADRPTRSALIGLAGAALGVERADSAGQKALARAFLTATRTLRPGQPLTDFHTFQSLPAGKGPAATRAHALAFSGDLETSITRRDYRADGLWQAAYCVTLDATVSLEALRDALLRPRFMLWAGRKSCPLAHPLAPLLIGSDDIESAFAEHARFVDANDGAALLGGGRSALAVDDRLGPLAGNRPARLHRRNDDPGDRMRWHFSSRAERVYAMAPVDPDEGKGR
ncbi:type I-E CRISPR-associated protein Cas5/CasD [Roseiarcus sp.]|uniref:type I-E CRISPR-associated protein Cas5/CasD n=1 Tax=Roseiarcus sp. TaxID=1969460 RepID=UPI003F9BA999